MARGDAHARMPPRVCLLRSPFAHHLRTFAHTLLSLHSVLVGILIIALAFYPFSNYHGPRVGHIQKAGRRPSETPAPVQH